MTTSTYTVQFDDGKITKGVKKEDLLKFIKSYFSDWMEGHERVVSWPLEDEGGPEVWGLRVYGEIEDFPTALVTEVKP